MFAGRSHSPAARTSGGKGTRTPGLRDANAPLSHLSYTPMDSPVFIAQGGPAITLPPPERRCSERSAKMRHRSDGVGEIATYGGNGGTVLQRVLLYTCITRIEALTAEHERAAS